jgi:thiamine-phosphate pyrophosphorylase
MLLPTVHLVTDRRAIADLTSTVRLALRDVPPSTVAVHVREKDLGGRALLALARVVGGACRAAGQLFLVNDRLDVALASGADGVHLPAAGVPVREARRLLGAERLVGVSCHSAADVARAAREGADYATFSPIYDTPSKRAFGPPQGVGALRDAAGLGLPLIALGGIDAGNVRDVVAAGAHGAAAIRAWLDAEDPGGVVSALLQATRAGGSAP